MLLWCLWPCAGGSESVSAHLCMRTQCTVHLRTQCTVHLRSARHCALTHARAPCTYGAHSLVCLCVFGRVFVGVLAIVFVIVFAFAVVFVAVVLVVVCWRRCYFVFVVIGMLVVCCDLGCLC